MALKKFVRLRRPQLDLLIEYKKKLNFFDPFGEIISHRLLQDDGSPARADHSWFLIAKAEAKTRE